MIIDKTNLTLEKNVFWNAFAFIPIA